MRFARVCLVGAALAFVAGWAGCPHPGPSPQPGPTPVVVNDAGRVVDAYAAFVADPTWETTLVQTNDIHPTAAGQVVLANSILASLAVELPKTTPTW